MKKLYLLLFFSITCTTTAQRTIHLQYLTPDTFQERIKSYDFSICDSLIMDGSISYSDFYDFPRFDIPKIRYLNIKRLFFLDPSPLIMMHDTWLHPILQNNTQQRLGGAFDRHKRLEEVILPDSLKILGRGSFLWCEKLKRVVLPPTLLVISDISFRFCSNLEEIEIPESVIAIGDRVLADTKVWSNTNEIRLPPNLEAIGVLHIGSKVKRIEISSENKFFSSVDGVLFDKLHKRLVRIPPRIGRFEIPTTTVIIEESAFSCSDIREIAIPDQIKRIKINCFTSCLKLTRVTLPNNDSLKLETRLFANSNKLRTIVCKSPIPYANGKKALDGLIQTCKIIVPKGAKEAYKQAEGWKDYIIIER